MSVCCLFCLLFVDAAVDVAVAGSERERGGNERGAMRQGRGGGRGVQVTGRM